MVNAGSLYAVGDDDQSIYGWRGARSRNIQFFKDEFKNVEIFNLSKTIALQIKYYLLQIA